MKKFLQLFSADLESVVPEKGSALLELFSAPKEATVSAPDPQRPPCAEVFNDEFIYFCQRNLPWREAASHMLVIGTTNAGKTIGCIKPFLKSILKRFKRGRKKPEQLIVFDAKCDAVPFFASQGFDPSDEDFWLFNPFDKRSAIWHIAEGVQEPARAFDFAKKLVPLEPNSTAPFFPTAAQLLAYSVILGLNWKKGKLWSLRDLLCALDSREHISAVAAHHPEGASICAAILNDQKHSPGVIASLATKVKQFSQVAALWASNPKARQFNIQTFLSRPGILILGNDPVLNASLMPFNSLLLRAVTDQILRRDETLEPSTWFVLDEYFAVNRVDTDKSTVDLLELGRSKGASVLIGIQSVAGMVEILGEAGANKMLGLCGHKMFLRAGEPQTGDWAERFFGKVRQVEATFSESWNKDGTSHSVQYSVQDRSLFTSAMFQNIPFPKQGANFYAISDVPSLGCSLISSRSFDQILSWNPPPTAIKAVEPRTGTNEQTLWPWKPEEEISFCRIENQPGELAKIETERPYLPRRKKKQDPNQRMLL